VQLHADLERIHLRAHVRLPEREQDCDRRRDGRPDPRRHLLLGLADGGGRARECPGRGLLRPLPRLLRLGADCGCPEGVREDYMAEPTWNQFLTERDKQVFAAAGYGARAGFGQRPALLVIDVNYNFCGDRREPILESITRWRNSCGAEAWDGVARIRELIDAAHAQGVPVIYTTGVRRPDNWDSGGWSWKNSRTEETPRVTGTLRDGDEIVDEIAPEPHDVVILKQKPSGFFGTNLLS